MTKEEILLKLNESLKSLKSYFEHPAVSSSDLKIQYDNLLYKSNTHKKPIEGSAIIRGSLLHLFHETDGDIINYLTCVPDLLKEDVSSNELKVVLSDNPLETYLTLYNNKDVKELKNSVEYLTYTSLEELSSYKVVDKKVKEILEKGKRIIEFQQNTDKVLLDSYGVTENMLNNVVNHYRLTYATELDLVKKTFDDPTYLTVKNETELYLHINPKNPLTFYDSATEQTVFCKGMLDRIYIDEVNKQILIIDYKENAYLPDTIGNVIQKFKYYLSAAYYTVLASNYIKHTYGEDFTVKFAFIIMYNTINVSHYVTMSDFDLHSGINGGSLKQLNTTKTLHTVEIFEEKEPAYFTYFPGVLYLLNRLLS